MPDERLGGLEPVDAGRLVEPGGGGRAGRDGVGGDARAGKIRERSGEADDTVFRGGAVAHVAQSQRASGRRNGNDATVRRSEERRYGSSGGGEHAGQVGSDDGVPLAVVDLPKAGDPPATTPAAQTTASRRAACVGDRGDNLRHCIADRYVGFEGGGVPVGCRHDVGEVL